MNGNTKEYNDEEYLILHKLNHIANQISEVDKKHENRILDMISIINLNSDMDLKINLEETSKNILNDLTLSELHVIDCIGNNKLCNTMFISKQLDITKGGISKISSKLLSKELIKATKLENNKKEIYYSLTRLGEDVYKIHKKLHQEEEKEIIKMISKYNKDELNTILKFLDDIIKII